MIYSNQRRKAQSGMTMVEILVSVVILSFGMLGLAGLQTKTLSFSQSSLYRSQATALADDILDRMRVDRDNALAGRWNSEITSDANSVSPLTFIYQTDLKDWKAQVESLLPSGRASVSVTNDRMVTIVIEWDDSRGREVPESWTTKSRL